MPIEKLVPKGEGLRCAVAWLLTQPIRDTQTIEQACQRFDLSPLDENFLLKNFCQAKTESFQSRKLDPPASSTRKQKTL